MEASGNGFVPTDTDDVVQIYGDIIGWVYGQPQFLPGAKTGFASGADGWLIAYAKTRVHHRDSRGLGTRCKENCSNPEWFVRRLLSPTSIHSGCSALSWNHVSLTCPLRSLRLI